MNKIRELRIGKGITQSELGKILSVQKAAISKYELGRATPSPEILKKLADYFHVSIDYLLGISDSPLSENQNANNKHPAFTDDEYKLLSNYRKLNHVGKVAAQGSVEALTLQKQFCTKIKTGEAT